MVGFQKIGYGRKRQVRLVDHISRLRAGGKLSFKLPMIGQFSSSNSAVADENSWGRRSRFCILY